MWSKLNRDTSLAVRSPGQSNHDASPYDCSQHLLHHQAPAHQVDVLMYMVWFSWARWPPEQRQRDGGGDAQQRHRFMGTPMPVTEGGGYRIREKMSLAHLYLFEGLIDRSFRGIKKKCRTNG